MSMSESRAMLELSYLNAGASGFTFDDFVLYGVERGIPKEILIRLKELWDKAKEVGGEVIQIGKVIVIKIYEFLKANPQIASSLAIGGAVFFLTSAIPLVGPFLAPLVGTLMTLAVFVQQSDLDGVIKIAKDFYRMFVEIFNAIAVRWA